MVPLLVQGQKFDNNWVIGHDYNINDDEHGRITLCFNISPPEINYDIGTVNMNMFVTNTSMSDSDGNLLFYSNGCNIANNDGQIILNGHDINPGYYHTRLCDEIGRGYSAGYSSAVILQLPESDSIYYMFHSSIKYIPPPQEDAYVDRLQYSIIKTSANKKLVLEKNTPIIIDSLASGELNAVKHANGKDWWVVQPKRYSNEYYIFLFTKNGVTDTLTQIIGDLSPINSDLSGQASFSPLGDKMVRYYPNEDIQLLEFDRETGTFVNYSTIKLDVGTSLAFAGGCSFSPNGQYLYVAALTNIYQFDMTASDISATQTTVATWDGFVDPIAISFLTCQLGPDCKIYILGGGDTKYYHIIHNPDEPGLACNVEQRGLVLPTPSGASIPYFPNYRLGPIDNPGLPCSPVVAMNHPPLPLPEVHVWPNPAHDQLGFSLVENSIKSISLRDALGRVVKTVSLGSSSGTYTMSVSDLAGGLYFWEIEDVKGRSLAGKVIIQ
jgi:hypothetical protein